MLFCVYGENWIRTASCVVSVGRKRAGLCDGERETEGKSGDVGGSEDGSESDSSEMSMFTFRKQ